MDHKLNEDITELRLVAISTIIKCCQKKWRG